MPLRAAMGISARPRHARPLLACPPPAPRPPSLPDTSLTRLARVRPNGILRNLRRRCGRQSPMPLRAALTSSSPLRCSPAPTSSASSPAASSRPPFPYPPAPNLSAFSIGKKCSCATNWGLRTPWKTSSPTSGTIPTSSVPSFPTRSTLSCPSSTRTKAVDTQLEGRQSAPSASY